MSISQIINQKLSQINQTIQMKKLNAQLPARAIYTAPSQKAYWFDITAIEFDASSLNEQTGEWGVFFISGTQYIETADGQFMTMTRAALPAYTFSAIN